MFRNYSFLIRYLFFCFFPLLFYGCISISQNPTNFQSPISKIGWDEVDRIELEYDTDFFPNMQFTSDDDYDLVFNIFLEHLKNAHLIKISSEIHLNENREHQFVIYRKWAGTEYVKFWVYKIGIVYRNYSIYYDFISNSTRGASMYGNDNGFFNLYNEDIDKFYINIDAEKRIIINRLSRNNDPIILGQAETINYSINKNFRRFFF